MEIVASKQPEIQALFKKIIQNGTLQHAYIFEGVAGSGKYEMALWIAQGLYCLTPKEDGSPCTECNQCLRIANEEHPDVTLLEPDGLSIKVDQVRAIKEEFSKSGMESRRKFLIVKDLEKMTINAANSLLKFIEEPEGQVTIIFLTTAVQQLLPTIVSRSQLIHFPVREITERIDDILSEGVPRGSATLLAYLTQDTQEALSIYQDDLFNQRVQAVWEWFNLLHKRQDQAFIYVQTHVMELIDNRESALFMLDLLLLIYRDLLAMSFEQDRVYAFSKYENQLKEMLSPTLKSQLADMLTIVLDGKKKLTRNVQSQGVLEQIALKLTSLNKGSTF